jgi:hypothetical protein
VEKVTFPQKIRDEFISAERRFIQRVWELAELDDGRFCEILIRILYHQDSGNLYYAKSFDDCVRYIENESLAHEIVPRHNALHLVCVLRTIYKFRSQRGAGMFQRPIHQVTWMQNL